MITMNLYYHGKNGNAKKFARAMIKSGLIKQIRNEPDNISYNYFIPLDDPETLLLIDTWKSSKSLSSHHDSSMMKKLAQLRDKYDLHMTVHQFIPNDQDIPKQNQKYIRK